MAIETFSASGKLLLFGEYLVLRESTCLAMPLAKGQHLRVQPNSGKNIHWQCFDDNQQCWLEINLSNDLSIIRSSDTEKAATVQKILKLILANNPALNLRNLNFRFQLDFNRQFGWGTSSTFISLLSQWSGVNAYTLLSQSFGGSGYDIAAAVAEKPFTYTIARKLENYCLLPETITQKLLFVYLGKKQTSSRELSSFKNKLTNNRQIAVMNNIVAEATQCRELSDWERLMRQSEKLLASILQIQPVQERYFSDYPHAIKSLGAWGGDFIMASCQNIDEGKSYFKAKGLTVSFTFAELIK